MKKQEKLKYKNTIKDLVRICDEKMPNSKYDKFYLEEMCKKYPKQDDLDGLIQKLNKIKKGFLSKFENMIAEKNK